MMENRMRKRHMIFLAVILAGLTGMSSCSSSKVKNRAMEKAARYWQDKAYPGKAHDIQVVEAEKADDGRWRVKGIVDGESRIGLFNPETESFQEGFYSLAKERDKHIAELEEQVKYWKEKSESLEKENYKLKVQIDNTKKR